MTVATSVRRKSRRSGSKSGRASLQKPNGVIGPRVAKVGGDRFAIVCIYLAKHRSEWMMADYFGNLLIEPQTVEHQSVFFNVAMEMIRQAQQQHDIRDTIVVVERTGNYYLPPSGPSPGQDLKRVWFIHSLPSSIECRPIRATKPMKTTCTRNTEPRSPALGCASWNWNLLIEICSCHHAIAAILFENRPR